MRLALFVALTVSAGIAMAQDPSPTKAQDAFNKAGVRQALFQNVWIFEADLILLQIPAALHIGEFKPKGVLEVSFPQTPQGSNPNPAPVPIPSSGAQLPENGACCVLVKVISN